MSTEKSMDATAGLMDSQELDTNAASSSSSAPELKENVDTTQANSISSGGTVVQIDSDFKMEEMSNVKGNSNEVKVETTSSESSKNLECVRNVPNTGVESMEEGHTDMPSTRRHCTEELPLSSDNAEVHLDSPQVLVTRLTSSIVDDILNEQITEDGSWQSIGNENSEERETNGIVEEILEEAMDEERVSNVEGLAQTLSSTNQELSSPRRSESDISLSEFINSPPLIYNTILPISPREEEFLLNSLEPHRLANNGMTSTNPLVMVRRLSSSNLNQPHAEHEEQIELQQQQQQQQQQLLTTSVAGAEGEHGTAPPEMEEEMMVPNEHGLSPSNIVENPNAIADEEDDIETEDGNDNDNDNVYGNNVEENSDSRRPHMQYAYDFEYNRLRDLMVRTRRTMNEEVASYSNAAHFEWAPRDSFMQRFRRILFILSSRRRRLIRLGLASPDVENGEDEPGAELDPDPNVTLQQFAQRLGMDVLVDFNETQAPVPSQRTEEEIPENAIRFDTNLPAEHSYMGNNMNRVCGVNYLDVGQQHNMMLFMHHALLFPGEILPFMVSGSIINDDIDSQNGFLFGVCFPFLNDSTNNENIYGVTCQIYEKGSDDRGNTLIKSRALQRFTTKTADLIGPLEYISDHPQMKCFGSVEILPDVYLPEPLKGVTMGSLSRFRDIDSMQSVYKRYQAAGSPWPIHIYEYYETSSIIEKARTQLAQHKIDTMPTDPIQLSYWLVRNLHLPENLMRSIFLTNSVNVRLELISRTFKEESIFSCRYCSSHIANCRELFAMSKHGVQTQYCNSAGYIHETNTLYQVKVDAILYSGAPSTDFSWFPGYQWHVIICKVCKHHLGWEFKAVKPNLVPKQFYGISSSGIRIRSANIYARIRFNPIRAMMNGGGDANSDIEGRDDSGDDIE